jgi:alpha-beta hydrolase superfamily lysophospholipase
LLIAAPTIPSCQFQFSSTDGLAIACARWDARGPVRGVVQIAHGMGEHIGRYAELIEVLVDSGLIVYGNDHRGHGRTAPYPQAFGDFGEGGFRLLVEDMFNLTLIAEKENPGKPLILLGHSMGSFAAQLYAIDHSRDIAGLVLSGSGALDGLVQLATRSTVSKCAPISFAGSRLCCWRDTHRAKHPRCAPGRQNHRQNHS